MPESMPEVAPRMPVTGVVGRTQRRNPLRYVGIDDPLLREFRGLRAVRTIDRMIIDPMIAGMIERTALLWRSTKWLTEPRSNDPIDREFAEYVNDNFERLEGGWKSVLAESSEMIGFGFQPFEVIYEQDGSDIRWAAFSRRDPRTIDDWIIEPGRGHVIAMRQRTDLGGIVDIPGWKLLNFQTRYLAGEPWGRTMIRGAFIPWTDKQETRRIIKVGLRRDLTGLATMQVPAEITQPDATDEEAEALRQAELLVREVERDEREGIIIPAELDARGNHTGYKFELLRSAGQRQFDVEGIFKMHNREIAIAIIGEFILLGHEQVGSFALASTKTGMFGLINNAILDGIAEHMERHAIPLLRAFNPRFANARIPRVKHGDIEEVPLKEWAMALSMLMRGGAIQPSPDLERVIRRKFRLPTAEGEEALTE